MTATADYARTVRKSGSWPGRIDPRRPCARVGHEPRPACLVAGLAGPGDEEHVAGYLPGGVAQRQGDNHDVVKRAEIGHAACMAGATDIDAEARNG